MRLKILLLSTIFSFAIAAIPDCFKDSDPTTLYWSGREHRYENGSLKLVFNLINSTDICSGLVCFENKTVLVDSCSDPQNMNFGEYRWMLTNTKNSNIKIHLYFSCEKNTLGYPMLLDSTDGPTYYFEWRSKIMCKGSIADTVPQIPCYVYDQGQLYDLTSLTKISTSHPVSKSDITLNVCRNITSGGCVAAACKGASAIGFALQNTVLKKTPDGLQLTYSGASLNCFTTINFFCPSNPKQAGRPMLTSSNAACNYTIEWYTMHACPAANLTNTTCQLRSFQYGIDFDLSALRNGGKQWQVDASGYVYTLGLCGANVSCNSTTTIDPLRGPPVACQLKENKPLKTLAYSEFTMLRYVDETLTMKLYKGEQCSSNFQRETLIRFYCNETIDMGQPMFVKEEDCTYLFDWQTSYACNRQSACTYVEGRTVYDFSSLTASGYDYYWSTSMSEGTRSVLNICGPVKHEPGCDSRAAVCGKSTSVTSTPPQGYDNLGDESTASFSRLNGVITLQYKDGAICNSETGARHQTIISFLCPDDPTTGPEFVQELSTQCIHQFYWYTGIVCNKTILSNPCLQSMNNGDFSYDFRSANKTLRHGDISLNPCGTPDYCGEVKGAHVCRRNNSITAADPAFTVVSTDLVIASYKENNTEQVEVEVWYNCNHTAADDPVISSVSEDRFPIKIQVETSLSCAPKEIACDWTEPNGDKYNLCSIKGQTFVAEDKSAMKYYFSVLAPLNKSDDRVKDCPGGPVSACQQTTSGELVNIGFVSSKPMVVSNGTIHLHYLNGKNCGHGNKTPRDTTMVMVCSESENAPQMVHEDENCNYRIWWRTPRACPVKNKIESMNCTVNYNNFKYDLSPLKDTQTVINGAETFYVRVCGEVDLSGKTTDITKSCSGSAVCKSNSTNQFFSYGLAVSGKFKAPSGRIQLEYRDGGPCIATSGDRSNRTTVIEFTCSAGPNKLELKYAADCYTHFEFLTSLVCPPLESVQCQLTTAAGVYYDLSALTQLNTNYQSAGISGEQFFINVCHQLISRPETSNCPPGSAVCERRYDNTTKSYQYISLGKLTSGVLKSIGNSSVMIQYEGGDVCPTNNNERLSTIILVDCDPAAKIPGMIRHGGKLIYDNCMVHFTWRSAEACPKPRASVITCDQLDKMNLGKLKGVYTVSDKNHQYSINLCHNDGQCNGTSYGVCQTLQGGTQVLAGLSNTSAVVTDDKIIFNYTDGDICQHDVFKRKRNSELTIYCNPLATYDSKPQFVREEAADCTYIFYWERPELCKKSTMTCSVQNSKGQNVDLSPLSQKTFSAISLVDDQFSDKYFYTLQICQSLPSTSNCPGAAVCRTSKSGSVSMELGRLDKPPTIDSNDEISLTYSTNTPCTGENSSKMVSTIIKFKCGSTTGVPYLVATDNCTYVFTLATLEACPVTDQAGTVDKCSILDVRSGSLIDLSPLKNKVFSAGNYRLSICSELPAQSGSTCKPGSAVCFSAPALGGSGGLLSTAQLNMRGKDVTLQYSNGSGCREENGDNSTVTSLITFICDPLAGVGSPEPIVTPDGCHYQFLWKTSLTCIADCQLDYRGHIYNLLHLASHRNCYTVSAGGYAFKINICKPIPSGLGCDDGSSVCATGNDGQHHLLGMTNSQFVDVWDDGTIIIRYSSAEKGFCVKADLTPTVIFKLTCSNSNDQPLFEQIVQNNCTIMFKWNTPVACPTGKRPEVVLDGNGNFLDPLTNDTYSISQALKFVTFDAVQFSYAVSLGRPITPADSSILTPNCTDGQTRVCQYNHGGFTRSIGTSMVKYVYRDDELQVELTSNSPCGRAPGQYCSTTINLYCNNQSQGLEFVDEMESCRYVLEWGLPSLCEPILQSSSSPKQASITSTTPPGVIAAITISVLVVLSAVAGFIIYRIRKSRSYSGIYEYSALNTDDDTTLLISGNSSSSRRYNSDDDDALII